MTSSSERIPLEIWMIVFEYIASPKQLLQCRLVCRKWDYPAETAMFGKDLKISRSKSVVTLYNHLVRKPLRSRLVRHLDVDTVEASSDLIDLLKVAFTPKMRYLGAGIDPVSAKFFVALFDIIKCFPQDTIYNIERMPESSILIDRNYARAAYTFRRTLQHLQISTECRAMSTYLKQLKVFWFLKTLSLEADTLESTAQLDAILRNCSHLDELELTSPDNKSYVIQNHDVISNWAKQSVEKVKTLTELTITFAHPDLVQYLVYKYPNIEIFTCSGDQYQHIHAMRVLTAVKDIPHFETKFSFDHHQDVQAPISAMCSIDEKRTRISAQVCYEPIDDGLEAEMLLKISNKEERHIDLILYAANHLPRQLHMGVLDCLKMLSSHCSVSRLEINMLSLDPAANGDAIPLHHIIDRMPAVESLTLTTERIYYESTPLDNQTGRNLQHLRIAFTEIDARVFPQISELFPNLHNLTIDSCTIRDHDKDEHHPEKVYTIHVPHSSLSVLNILATPKHDYYRQIHPQIMTMTDNNRIAGDCYLKVSVLEVDIHMYCRLNASSAPVFLSPQEFESRSHNPQDASIYITCANVVALYISLVDVEFDFKVKNFVIKAMRKELDKSMVELESSTRGCSLEDQYLLKKLESKGKTLLSFRERANALEKKPFLR